MPKDLDGDFDHSIMVLKLADDNWYTKLCAHDLKRKSFLLEQLGQSLDQLYSSVFE